MFTITMFLQYFVVFLHFLAVNLTSLHNEHRQTIERVEEYLRQFDMKVQIQIPSNYLPNSNKIGSGYDLLAGSPVCYTGACQMTEFTRSIFKLNYTSRAPGSCTNKLIPNNVDLDCIPSTSTKIVSEIIDTVEHVYRSVSNKAKVSVGAKFLAKLISLAFSYSSSKETRTMLDNIVKRHQTSIVSYFISILE
jgi:hypothetical protein